MLKYFGALAGYEMTTGNEDVNDVNSPGTDPEDTQQYHGNMAGPTNMVLRTLNNIRGARKINTLHQGNKLAHYNLTN